MRKATKLAVLLTAATLVIAACGDDGGSSSATTATTAAPTTTAAMAEKDIVDTAVAAGNFTTLASALQAAGLVEALKGPGPFTVFAPTDEAFAKVPKETLDKLLANKEALTRVLTYHVVAGKVMAADVKPGEVEMLSKDKATIKVDGGKVMIEGANVVKTDIVASNGVIHVIDAVILPEGLTL